MLPDYSAIRPQKYLLLAISITIWNGKSEKSGNQPHNLSLSRFNFMHAYHSGTLWTLDIEEMGMLFAFTTYIWHSGIKHMKSCTAWFVSSTFCSKKRLYRLGWHTVCYTHKAFVSLAILKIPCWRYCLLGVSIATFAQIPITVMSHSFAQESINQCGQDARESKKFILIKMIQRCYQIHLFSHIVPCPV